MVVKSKGNPLISGKSGLVKYYNLATSWIGPRFRQAFSKLGEGTKGMMIVMMRKWSLILGREQPNLYRYVYIDIHHIFIFIYIHVLYIYTYIYTWICLSHGDSLQILLWDSSPFDHHLGHFSSGTCSKHQNSYCTLSVSVPLLINSPFLVSLMHESGWSVSDWKKQSVHIHIICKKSQVCVGWSQPMFRSEKTLITDRLFPRFWVLTDLLGIRCNSPDHLAHSWQHSQVAHSM